MGKNSARWAEETHLPWPFQRGAGSADCPEQILIFHKVSAYNDTVGMDNGFMDQPAQCKALSPHRNAIASMQHETAGGNTTPLSAATTAHIEARLISGISRVV